MTLLIHVLLKRLLMTSNLQLDILQLSIDLCGNTPEEKAQADMIVDLINDMRQPFRSIVSEQNEAKKVRY